MKKNKTPEASKYEPKGQINLLDTQVRDFFVNMIDDLITTRQRELEQKNGENKTDQKNRIC